MLIDPETAIPRGCLSSDAKGVARDLAQKGQA
jgi:hypothetical protein